MPDDLIARARLAAATLDFIKPGLVTELADRVDILARSIECQRRLDVACAGGIELAGEDVRNFVLAFVEAHEEHGCENAPPGHPCWVERTNILAYLCHCLGVRGDRLHRDVAGRVGVYDLHCADQSCKHEIQ